MRYPHCLLLLLLLLLLPLAVPAQRPDYNKMSPLVREACRDALSMASARRVAGDGGPVLTAFVKVADADTDVLESHGCRILCRYGSLCVACIPLTAIAPLSLDGRVMRIEAGRRATALMDTTAVVVNALPVSEGLGLPQGYTGRGVVVGVEDIGFDLTHPTFWSPDMSEYRIKAMWDQLSDDTLDSSLPVGRDYKGEAELLRVQHPRDGLAQTHGTHTAGIAAGSGAEGGGVVSPYRGIAYDADICMVCNATSDDAGLIDKKDYYKYTYATDALGFKYIFDYADSVGKPCVINFSEGSGMDFRGDDQLYYEMLDSISGPGHIIVASAGNSGGKITRVHKSPLEPSKAVVCYPGSDYSYVTTRSRAGFMFSAMLSRNGDTAHVDIPLAAVLASKDSTYTDSIVSADAVNTIVATAYRSCFDPADIICDWRINRDTSLSPADGGRRLTLQLTGDTDVEMFPVVGTLMHTDGSGPGEGENFYSVNSPGSASSVICVGMTGYRNHITNYLGQVIYPGASDKTDGLRHPASSVGPTFDGRMKPDVMAPGQNIISSYSSFYEENNPTATDCAVYDVRRFTYNGRTYAWNSNSGTSMASPVVAGVIALWLQADPTLTPDDCRDIIAATSNRTDSTLQYPNNYYGYGQIDAEAGMHKVLERLAAGIHDINAAADAGTSSTSTQADDRHGIYSIDGRLVGTDISSLPKGLYIVDGRKVVK